MTRRITAVKVGYDQIDGTGIKVGSTEWFEWLEGNRSFHYSCSQGHFTANKNNKGYWYAQRRSEGSLLQHYMGQSSKLSLDVLKDAAIKLSLAVIENRPHNRLTKALEQQSCKSCMTEKERLRQSSKRELIDLVIHLKQKLQDYKTQSSPTLQSAEIEALKKQIEELNADNDELKQKIERLATVMDEWQYEADDHEISPKYYYLRRALEELIPLVHECQF